MNIDIVDKALSDIDEHGTNAVILLRSTVVPGTTNKLQGKYPNLRLVFNPEFLTERSANFDFINQDRVILGGDINDVEVAESLFKSRFGSTISILKTNYETAELIKYMTNTFFATKISFLNDMKLIADKSGVIWKDAIDGFIRDGRVGHSHLDVPGHDGKYGFGGSCFPKDIQALINFGNGLGIEMSVLKGAWKTNLKVRPEKDWENLKGRAIVDENN